MKELSIEEKARRYACPTGDIVIGITFRYAIRIYNKKLKGE